MRRIYAIYPRKKVIGVLKANKGNVDQAIKNVEENKVK